MARVVPWPEGGPGYINLHWRPPTRGPGEGGRPLKTLDEFMSLAQYAALRTKTLPDVMFCLSLQGNTRIQKNGKVGAKRGHALKLKALWADIDGNKPDKPDKGYPDKRSALAAIVKFCADAKIVPPTAIVDSGNGFHIYWISDRALTPEEWWPYASGLDTLMKQHGLLHDPVTTDRQRILRVPGTFNCKDEHNHKPVMLYQIPDPTQPPTPEGKPATTGALGRDYNFAVDLAQLPALSYPDPKAPKPGRPAAVTAAVKPPPFDMSAFANYKVPAALADLDPLADCLSDGLHHDTTLALDPAQVYEKCPHFRDTLATGGAGQSETLWDRTILATTFFEGGRLEAHRLSSGYVAYKPEETDKKFDQKVKYKAEQELGWPTCKGFENAGCKACATCPLRGLITSPLTLARRIKPAGPSIAQQAAVDDLLLPPGFTVNENNLICLETEAEDKENPGVFEPYLVPMFHNEIRGPWAEFGKLHFQASTGRGNWKNCTITEAELGNLVSLKAALSREMCHSDKKGEAQLEHFMKSWIGQIAEAADRQVIEPYGWVKPSQNATHPTGFAYAGECFHADGSVTPTSAAQPHIARWYTPSGAIEPVINAIRMICGQENKGNRTHLEVLLASVAFAAPLMITASGTATLWGWSGLGGVHKTTSLLTGNAVWGHPDATMIKKPSPAGLEVRMGGIRHLPVAIDEIDSWEAAEGAVVMINHVSENSSQARATRNRTAGEQFTWRTAVTVGSNKPIRDVIMAKGNETDAKLKRVLQMEIPKVEDSLDQFEIEAVVMSLNHNYGHLGRKYAEWLGTHYEEVAQRMDAGRRAFQRLIPHCDSTFRYWINLCVAILLGAELANEILGEELFHVEDMRALLREVFIENHRYIKEKVEGLNSRELAESQMAEYLKHVLYFQVWTDDYPPERGKPGLIPVLSPTYTNAGKPLPIHVRWYVKGRVVRISWSSLRNFLRDTKQVGAMDNILKQLGGKVLPSIVTLNAGMRDGSTQLFRIAQSREKVIQFDIPKGHFLETNLHAFNAQPPSGDIAHGLPHGNTGPVDAFAIAAAQSAAAMALVQGMTGAAP